MDAALRLALKKLSHRNWSELQEEWLNYVPLVEFDKEYPEPTLWQLENFPGILGHLNDGNILEHIDGMRDSIFRESLILTRKFNHSRSMITIAAAQGRSTWASINAYEACFYGAKAFCYLLGFANIGRDSPYYLDVFFEIQLSRRKGLIENRYDMKLHRLPERLSHSVLWGLIERLINTTTFSAQLSAVKAELRKVDWEGFSKFRNLLMYDGSFWTKLDNYNDCDLINLTSDVSIYRASAGKKNYDHLPFGREYFHVVDLFESALSLMLEDLANRLPALRGEVQSVKMSEA